TKNYVVQVNQTAPGGRGSGQGTHRHSHTGWRTARERRRLAGARSTRKPGALRRYKFQMHRRAPGQLCPRGGPERRPTLRLLTFSTSRLFYRRGLVVVSASLRESLSARACTASRKSDVAVIRRPC